MKKLVLILAAICMPAVAMKRTGETPDGTWYYLESSVRDGVVRAWMLLDRRVPDAGARSSKVLYEVDCRERKVRVSMRNYAGQLGEGAAVSSIDGTEWMHITPGSNPHSLATAFCR